MYIEDESVLASRSENEGIPSLTFELRGKPFYEGHEVHTQHYVASIDPLAFGEDEQVTFSYPFLPELNDFYQHEACRGADGARSERSGLGIVTDVGRETLTIRALRQRSLVASVFEAFGMKAQTSEAGRIASRLIQQMGGVQGCRVFKIAGVRKLIEKYKPLQSFTRGEAMQIIGDVDPATNIPNFARYEPLFIEPREGPNLKPSHVFDFMARKKVFRVGLKFMCSELRIGVLDVPGRSRHRSHLRILRPAIQRDASPERPRLGIPAIRLVRSGRPSAGRDSRGSDAAATRYGSEGGYGFRDVDDHRVREWRVR